MPTYPQMVSRKLVRTGAHLPKHDDGAGRLGVAATVDGVRAHVVRVRAAAIAAAEQLIHLGRVEQPQQ